MLVEEQAEVVDEEPELLERLRLTVQVPQRLALVPRASVRVRRLAGLPHSVAHFFEQVVQVPMA